MCGGREEKKLGVSLDYITVANSLTGHKSVFKAYFLLQIVLKSGILLNNS